MAIITHRIKVNENIELSTFYTLNATHDVVCLDFKTVGGSEGHVSVHFQLTRPVVQELINALIDTLAGKADKEDE